MENFRALGIRQPHAEAILRGIKKVEYRSQATKVRGRVYIYASGTPGPRDAYPALAREFDRLPRGVLVGTVEISGCREGQRGFEWTLVAPQRLAQPVKPLTHPQPVWFYPFGLKGEGEAAPATSAPIAEVSAEPTTRLVDDVLSTMPGDIPEDIIDRVFVAIESDRGFLARYKGLCSRMGQRVLNARIGHCTRVAAGFVATRDRRPTRTSLAKTFTILRRA